MKKLIVGFLIFSASTSMAGLCKGNFYTRADNGTVGLERAHFVITSNPRDKFVLKKHGNLFRADFEKSDDWTYYSYVDKEEYTRVYGYRNTQNDFNYSELRADKESFLKFKEKAVVGFNLVCRM